MDKKFYCILIIKEFIENYTHKHNPFIFENYKIDSYGIVSIKKTMVHTRKDLPNINEKIMLKFLLDALIFVKMFST